MTANNPMTGEQLDELMTVAVNMQRDSEKVGERRVAMFAYAVQVAVLELRQVREMKPTDENHVAAMNSIKAIISILGSSDTLGISAQVAELKAQRDALAAENAGLKESRVILAENTLETCNEIASAGFRHEAIMRGLYESTGNRNKYPKPITTLVDEALRKLETHATDAFLAEVRACTIETAADDLASQNNIGAHEHNAMYIYAENLRKGAQS